jgi:hypothetical protein
MSKFAACTIVAHNYLPQARVLADSFHRHHPEARFVVVVVDRPIETRLAHGENFEALPVTDIDFGDEGFADMAMIYDVTEFATAVKPFALRHLLKEHECVFYLDPDIQLFSRLDPLIEATLAAGWSLTPHCLHPILRDGTSPTEHDIMQAGIYNLGFVGVTSQATEFIEWWAERLRRDAIIDPANQLFTDQRWIDLAVPIFAPHIERSTAYNVAYWNVDQRRLWRDGASGATLRRGHRRRQGLQARRTWSGHRSLVMAVSSGIRGISWVVVVACGLLSVVLQAAASLVRCLLQVGGTV